MGPIGCPEMSVRNYHSTLCNDPEERSSHLIRDGSPKPRSVSPVTLYDPYHAPWVFFQNEQLREITETRITKSLTIYKAAICIFRAIPVQAWTDPEGPRRSGRGSQISRQSAHEGGKVVSLTLRQPDSTPRPQCSGEDYVNEKFQ